ncbi:MAG: glutamate synthase large subunit [Acidobacteriota bacterium]|nr:glutamate synthase large subunit [Acidobacteriota bacterium]
MTRFFKDKVSAACGVGFLAGLDNRRGRDHVERALKALVALEHRGGTAADRKSSDGAGIMTEIPFHLFEGCSGSGKIAVAMLFLDQNAMRRGTTLDLFEKTFNFMGLNIEGYREVPLQADVLGPIARKTLPVIRQAVIARPGFCRTMDAFEKLLYKAHKMTMTKLRDQKLEKSLYFSSLSARTIVYKALCRAADLDKLYPDLADPRYTSRFALFHRRFSTNTATGWDVAQPFSTIGHNGEINTIAGNRSWSASREMSMGLPHYELITREDISDSGSLNQMVEALRFRSSIRRLEEILAITIPPARSTSPYYRFWSRAMEPWDGPAMVAFGDGERVGARLDRNGFRPCRWVRTKDTFLLASEAGPFDIDERDVVERGALAAGTGVVVRLDRGEVDFNDPGSTDIAESVPSANLVPLEALKPPTEPLHLEQRGLFVYTREDFDRILIPMISTGKEPIGSMGDTARSALLSNQPRSFFDFFYQNFAQVTNPPLDYLREGLVCDLTVHLGKRPNIFAPRELIPPRPAIETQGPVLSLGEMAYIDTLPEKAGEGPVIRRELAMTFPREWDAEGLERRLKELEEEAVEAVKAGISLLVLSDRNANKENPPVPSLLALRAVVRALNRRGLRLEASLLVCSGEIRETHHAAALVSFGASAVCPYLALEIARYTNHPKLKTMSPDRRERNLIDALVGGLQKIMSKMGISVVRSYQSSKLFTPMGLDAELIRYYFKGLESPIGGVTLLGLGKTILQHTERPVQEKPLHIYLYKEQNRGQEGEKHAMTNSASKVIHRMVHEEDPKTALSDYNAYLDLTQRADPVNLRHLFDIQRSGQSLPMEEVQDRASILATFGSGAMSFGAISAESQRDIFKAMQRLGARSNSGEGGENPFYHIDGTTADTKQVASGRFGVTAAYLAPAREFQIKMAQGAKPGEGGQLMGVKVSGDIARARHAIEGSDLISPPPMHDIYSIEDLKQLIYELKQFKPEARVSVKLVSGVNIGTIAVGVAKAGADIIHIAGGDGGTGAAALGSMKHAGLPWELGLAEVHRALTENDLRDHVTLRVDGGLQNGRDIVLATLLGAEQYDFGKLLLVAQGCVMARICEKNTCPTGIATQDPKFKAKYKGRVEDVERLLIQVADHVRRLLAAMGARNLTELVGRTDLLEARPHLRERLAERGIDLKTFTATAVPLGRKQPGLFFEGVNSLNQRVVNEAWTTGNIDREIHLSYPICNRDRGVPATLSGRMAEWQHKNRNTDSPVRMDRKPHGTRHLTFRGSAGQGFGAFLSEGMEVTLWGEANDSVGKAMSGGCLVVRPSSDAQFDAASNAIVGNCVLYGATGGTLYAHGRAGDRFAVRNSGAIAVAEGAGLHACEYMTGGTVVLLGGTGANVGAGMTGGTVYLFNGDDEVVNRHYVTPVPLENDDRRMLTELLEDYQRQTGSRTAADLLAQGPRALDRFRKYLPHKTAGIRGLVPRKRA